MSDVTHKWGRFYSPRNGRISIEACTECGIAKGIVTTSHACKSTSSRSVRLKGWSQSSSRNAQTSSINYVGQGERVA